MRLIPAAVALAILPLLILGPRIRLEAQNTEFTLNVNVDLVELRVTVLDPESRFVTGLGPEDFRIYEDRVPQQVSLFRTDDLPVSLGLVIDNSRSMERKKRYVDAAALSFVRHSNPDDETFLIHFDNDVRLAHDFTRVIAPLEETLRSSRPFGQTALFDAILAGIERVEAGRYQQKAILLVSDGADNASEQNFERVLAAVRESDAIIYAIGLLGHTEGALEAGHRLGQVADVTGGRAFFPTTVEEIPELTEQIARELRQLYTVGYAPTNARRDGSWRSVRVEVDVPPDSPRLTLNYRHGYYAPGNNAGNNE